MWQELPDPSKDEIRAFRRIKKVKLYADEDIEDQIVTYLRDKRINITSARELGYRGKPDSFHAAYAFKKKRFLLTKNEKDFFNDRDLPFNRTHGVIAVTGDMGNVDEYKMSLLWLIDIIVPDEYYRGKKIRISPREVMAKFIGENGHLVIMRFKQEKGRIFVWVD
jgi:predicted nuclease of predicted toxin-antitoxin system